MPHVITQSCCNDGSCVFACPVNCIHPSPDEPGFATSEMLYIDPVACVDCGACVSACPVGAIAPDARSFDRVGEAHALAAGVALPAPSPIFPRYTEATEETAAKPAPKTKGRGKA